MKIGETPRAIAEHSEIVFSIWSTSGSIETPNSVSSEPGAGQDTSHRWHACG
jgi:hypothetical protein